jgi:hypothetical protein
VVKAVLSYSACLPDEQRTGTETDPPTRRTRYWLYSDKNLPRTRTGTQGLRSARKLATAEDRHPRGEDVLLVELERKLLGRWYVRFHGAGERDVRVGRGTTPPPMTMDEWKGEVFHAGVDDTNEWFWRERRSVGDTDTRISERVCIRTCVGERDGY